MRMPPRLIVESERPEMIAVPRLGDLDPVAVAPDAGEHVEVALAIALAVGRSQKKIGIDGIGSVITSSPTSPISGSPSGLQDSTAQPSARACSSPS
jgi:hypothetical protein